MAWIESHQRLRSDPALLTLAVAMGWSVPEAIGRLHLFWWWCVDHCENGDLRRYHDGVLAAAVELNPAEGKRFVDALVGEDGTGFVERTPYFRVRNWWKFHGYRLQKKYARAPEKWKEIHALYEQESSLPANIPAAGHNQTKPNQTNSPQSPPASPKAPRARRVFEKPSQGDVSAYMRKLPMEDVSAEFIDHYEMTGWKSGKNPIVDWQAAVRTWKRRRDKDRAANTTNGERVHMGQHGPIRID